MVDVLSGEGVLIAAVDVLELAGRDEVAIEFHRADVTAVDDDVDMVGADVDVLVVEGGEGDLVDALLDGGNPNHRGVTDGVAASRGVVEIHGSRSRAVDETRLFVVLQFEDNRLVDAKCGDGCAVLADHVVVGGRGDLHVIFFALEGAGHHKLFAPRLQRHGLLEDMVEAASVCGHGGEVVAVEHGDALAIACLDA